MENGTHLTMIVYPALITVHLSGLAQRLSLKAISIRSSVLTMKLKHNLI